MAEKLSFTCSSPPILGQITTTNPAPTLLVFKTHYFDALICRISMHLFDI
jgi:hypothetical protein